LVRAVKEALALPSARSTSPAESATGHSVAKDG
jgi:hypothetical protein